MLGQHLESEKVGEGRKASLGRPTGICEHFMFRQDRVGVAHAHAGGCLDFLVGVEFDGMPAMEEGAHAELFKNRRRRAVPERPDDVSSARGGTNLRCGVHYRATPSIPRVMDVSGRWGCTEGRVVLFLVFMATEGRL